MRPLLAFLVCITLGLLGPTSGQSAPAKKGKSNLSVRSLSGARTATPGGVASVDVTVVRSGRTGAAALRFYLSADRTRDRGDTALAGTGKVAAGGPSGGVQTSASPKLPAEQKVGAYQLIACVDDPARVRETNERDNCRATPLTVTPEPVGTRELVASAVAAGRLSPQEGLVYRVFATFGDSRLPDVYAGDPAASDHLAMREVVEKWSTLSAAQRKQLRPFLLPPAAKGSWADDKTSVRASGAGDITSFCRTEKFRAPGWESVAGAHVRIWWRAGGAPRVERYSRALIPVIEKRLWPALRSVMGREPLSDDDEPCFHGGDGKLDIYMADLPAHKGASTTSYPTACTGGPSYITFDSSRLPTLMTVAHELMHAFQFAFKYASGCTRTAGWDEAVAVWAGSWLYEDDNQEHGWDDFMLHPEQSLKIQDYDGWIFPYAVAKLHGPGTIGAIAAQAERLDIWQAVDAGIPGGMRLMFPDFARLAWNQDPVDPTFRQWDGFTVVPQRSDGTPIEAEQLDVDGSGRGEIAVPLDLQPLARTYRRIKFGPGVTQVTIGTPGNDNVWVDAFVRLRDGTRYRTYWNKRVEGRCPLDPAKRFDEVILVVSNRSLTEVGPKDAPLRVVGNNLGCARYTGTASGTIKSESRFLTRDETWSATGLVFENDRDASASIALPLVAGTFRWTMNGTSNTCVLSASGTSELYTGPGAGRQGLLLSAWSGPTNEPERRFRLAVAPYLATPVMGNERCHGRDQPTPFRASPYIGFDNEYTFADVLPDGSIEGSSTVYRSGTRYTSQWRLVPDR